MTIRMLAAALAAAATFAGGAAAAGAAHSVAITCGTVKAAGFTFHVAHVRLPSCAAARSLTVKLAKKGLPRLGIRRYPGIYLSMHCFAAVKGKAAQIQCTSGNGKKSLYAIAKG